VKDAAGGRPPANSPTVCWGIQSGCHNDDAQLAVPYLVYLVRGCGRNDDEARVNAPPFDSPLLRNVDLSASNW